MFHSLALAITPLLETYGVLGVFLASITEEIIAPIPSSVVVLSAGFLLTNGADLQQATIIVLLKIMLPASLGITLGSLFPYYLARLGGAIAIDKFGWLLGVRSASLKRAEEWFAKHKSDEILLFLVRTIPVIPSVIIGLFCGLVRMPVGEFLLYSFLGSLIRTFILGMIGWWAGRAYLELADRIGRIEDIVLAVVVIAGIGAAIYFWRRMRRGPAPL